LTAVFLSTIIETGSCNGRPAGSTLGDIWGIANDYPHFAYRGRRSAQKCRRHRGNDRFGGKGLWGIWGRPKASRRPAAQAADPAAKYRAYRKRKKARDETRHETFAPIAETIVAAGPRHETRDETDMDKIARPDERHETRDEPPPCAAGLYRPANEQLLAALTEAARGNFDPLANLEPMRDVIRQGCDLEQDVVPVVAALIPELPRAGAPRGLSGRSLPPATSGLRAGPLRPHRLPGAPRPSSGTNDPRMRTIDKGDYR
jgi:hypothetical protein